MQGASYVILALALVGLVYISVKMVPMVQRAGFPRLVKALGAFVSGIASACARLFATNAGAAASPGELKAPGEGDDWNDAWDKVGAVAAPEQYLHHPDQEVSSLARAHFDDN